MNYTDRTNYLVPCFEDMLVQATKENIGLFTEAIDSLDPEGKTQLGQALEVAFNLLAKVALFFTGLQQSYSLLSWNNNFKVKREFQENQIMSFIQIMYNFSTKFYFFLEFSSLVWIWSLRHGGVVVFVVPRLRYKF